MLQFNYEPNVGPLPIRFGMLPKQVTDLLGSPLALFTSHFGGRIEERPNMNIGYSELDNRLNEVVFTPGSRLTLLNYDLFDEPDLVGFLKRFDPHPYLFVGFIIFRQLGVRLSGFHDGDDDQLAIGVVPTTYWDEYAADLTPFDG